MSTIEFDINLTELVGGLEKEDQRNLKLTRNMKRLFWVMIPIYFLLFVANPFEEFTWHHRVGGACYVLAFSIFAWFFHSYHKDYKNVDYSLPTMEMLKKAAYRYKIFHFRTAIMIFPLILIDLGMFLIGSDIGFMKTENLLYGQLMFWGIMAISFSIGVMIWYKRQRPLRNQALELIRELESE
jgi:magnesium-transporting ATPase (P-type)